MHFYGHAHVGAKMVSTILRRLKMDNKTIKLVTRLVEHHDDRPVADKKEPVQIRKSVNIIGKDIYDMYLQLAYADIQGKSQYGREKGMEMCIRDRHNVRQFSFFNLVKDNETNAT